MTGPHGTRRLRGFRYPRETQPHLQGEAIGSLCPEKAARGREETERWPVRDAQVARTFRMLLGAWLNVLGTVQSSWRGLRPCLA